MTILAHYDASLNTSVAAGGNAPDAVDLIGIGGTLAVSGAAPTYDEDIFGLWGWKFNGTTQCFAADLPGLEKDDIDIIAVIKRGTASGFQALLALQNDAASATTSEAGVIVRFSNSNMQVLISDGDGWCTQTSDDAIFPAGWEGVIHVRCLDGVFECRVNGELLPFTASGEAMPAAIDYATGNTPYTILGGLSPAGVPTPQFDGIIGEVVFGVMTAGEYRAWTESLLEKWGFSKRLELFISTFYQSSSTATKTVVQMERDGEITEDLVDFPRGGHDYEIHFPHVIARPDRWHMFYAGLNSSAARWFPCYAYSDNYGKTWVKPSLGRIDALGDGSTANNAMFLLPVDAGYISDFHVIWDDIEQRFVFMVHETSAAGDLDARCYIGHMLDPLQDVTIKRFVAGETDFNTTGTGTGAQKFETKSLVRFPSGRWGVVYTFDHTAQRRSLGMYKTIGTDFMGTWYDAGSYIVSSAATNQYYAFMPSQYQHLDGRVIVGTENKYNNSTDLLGPLRPAIITDGHSLEHLDQTWLDLGATGAFDEKFIMHASFEDCDDDDNKLRLYYSGGNVVHGSYPRNTELGVATLTKHRYVQMSNGTFTTTTMPMTSSSMITVNATGTGAGITYSLLDAAGASTQFTEAKCTPITTDGTAHVLKWNNSSVLPNGNFAVKFTVPANCKLYSYEFDRSELPVVRDLDEEVVNEDYVRNSDFVPGLVPARKKARIERSY